MFFPQKGQSAVGNEAIMVCFGCPVRRECNRYAHKIGNKWGIWGAEWFSRTND